MNKVNVRVYIWELKACVIAQSQTPCKQHVMSANIWFFSSDTNKKQCCCYNKLIQCNTKQKKNHMKHAACNQHTNKTFFKHFKDKKLKTITKVREKKSMKKIKRTKRVVTQLIKFSFLMDSLHLKTDVW